LLLGLAIHLPAAAGTLRAQPPPLPIEVIVDWSYYNNMAWTAFNRGDYNIAENRFHAAIDLVRPYAKVNQRLLVRSYHDLTRVLYAQKRYAAAEPLAKWVVDVRRIDKDLKPEILFDGIYLLALIHREQGHDAVAESLFHEAMQIEEKAVGPDNPSLAATLGDLAIVEFRLEKYDRAELHLRRSLALRRESGARPDAAYIDALERYAKVLDQLDRGTEARETEEAVERMRSDLREAAERARKVSARVPFGHRPGDVRRAAP
jgi:tetratricopeptide (TPR) repeat protein